MKKIHLKSCAIVLSGVPLTGKTTLAKKLSGVFDFQMIDVDAVRNEIDESRKADGLIKMLDPDKEKTVMARSYAEMCQRAEKIVRAGTPVIILGTFSRAEFKQPLEQLIESFKKDAIAFKIFLLTISDEEALRRIEKRRADGGLSNIDSLEKYQWAKGIFSEIEFAPVTEVDTSTADYVNKVIEDLKGGFL